MAISGRGKLGIKWLQEHVSYPSEFCLIWPFHRNSAKGYGQFWHNGSMAYAHRMMCEMVHGPAPDDKPQAAHSCGNGHLGCVNPRHLSWASNSENQATRYRQRPSSEWKVRLTAEDVAEIRALKGKMTQAKIAERFRVSPCRIAYWHNSTHEPRRTGPGSDYHREWRRKKRAERHAELSANNRLT